MRTTFYIAGALIELVGIVVIAAPDFVPGARRAGAWLRVHVRREVDRLRRLIGRPRRQVIQVAGITSAEAVGRASLVTSVRADATIEEKTEFLLRRDQEAQRDLNQLASRVSAIESESPERLDELRTELQVHFAAQLAASDADYRAARIAGAIALAIGLGLATAANFVG